MNDSDGSKLPHFIIMDPISDLEAQDILTCLALGREILTRSGLGEHVAAALRRIQSTGQHKLAAMNTYRFSSMLLSGILEGMEPEARERIRDAAESYGISSDDWPGTSGEDLF